jgi:hypothetical protein
MLTSYAHDQTKREYKGLRRAVQRSHGCGRQVDALLRGGCRGLRTTGALDFVLPRPPILDDKVVVVVRFVRGGVRRPQGVEAVGRYQEWHVPVVHTVLSAHHR